MNSPRSWTTNEEALLKGALKRFPEKTHQEIAEHLILHEDMDRSEASISTRLSIIKSRMRADTFKTQKKQASKEAESILVDVVKDIMNKLSPEARKEILIEYLELK